MVPTPERPIFLLSGKCLRGSRPTIPLPSGLCLLTPFHVCWDYRIPGYVHDHLNTTIYRYRRDICIITKAHDKISMKTASATTNSLPSPKSLKGPWQIPQTLSLRSIPWTSSPYTTYASAPHRMTYTSTFCNYLLQSKIPRE